MIIRRTEEKDKFAVLNIFDEARQTIASLGIDQWQDGYPGREVVESDIREGISYIVECGGKAVGTFVLRRTGDITYDKIYNGHWSSGDGNKNYTAMHRVAISVASRGRGISGEIINFAVNEAAAEGQNALRIDTHEGNVVMRRMLEKNGFKHCGTIYLLDGKKRVAYEKIIGVI